MIPLVLNLVGWAGSALLIVSLLQNNVRRLRLLNLASSLILVAYNALLPIISWPMVGLNVALAVINVVKLYQERSRARAHADEASGLDTAQITHPTGSRHG